MIRRHLTIALLAGLAAGCSGPADPAGPPIDVTDAWARATAPGQTGGVAYLTIDNRGSEPDRLVAIRTARAGSAMLHESRATGGVMRMRMIGAIEVPAHASVALSPGATHIMLDRLSSPLASGETFALDLRFERAGEVRVPVKVVAVGAR